MNSLCTRIGISLYLTIGWAGVCLSETSKEEVTDWNGYKRRRFDIAGRHCFITAPKIAAPGKPWVLRTQFPDFHPEVDIELLHCGYHIAFMNVDEMYGCDSALDLWDQFYEHVVEERGMSRKPALEAVSRGGLYAYRYAARRPKRISCIYADTPVMDIKSWPGGRGKGLGSPEAWRRLLKQYGFKSPDEALSYRGNPIDSLKIIADAKIPLRHVISLSDKVVPPEENTLKAKKRLEELGHSMEVVAVKEGTPESNGHHFPLPAVFESAQFIMRHTHVLPKGNEYYNLRRGLGNSRRRFEQEKFGRVAFLGGSITFNPGWRNEVMRYLRRRFPKTKLEVISAGIPSLGSVPNAFRLERDVLSYGRIDLLFVEAAVNDPSNGTSPERMIRGMEGIVGHTRLANPFVDIVDMHFVMPEHIKVYSRGRIPLVIRQDEKVAERYGIATLNLAREVTERINASELTWEGDFKNLHPSPYGQRVYANSMMRMLDAAYLEPASELKEHELPKPVDPMSYFRGRLVGIEKVRIVRGFTIDPNWTPRDGKGTRSGFVRVPALVAVEPNSEFELDLEGTGVGLFITSGPDAGIVEFSVDGADFRHVDSFTPWSPNLHLPWALMLDDTLKLGRHRLRVRLSSDRNPRSLGTALRVFHLLVN